MVTRLLVLALVAACAPHPSATTTPHRASHAVASSTSDEDRYYATQAALLDPRCWHLASTTTGTLDVTVPAGRTWWTSNALAVMYGDPLIVAQDAWPGSRSSGFLRNLDARSAVRLPAGTRIRNNQTLPPTEPYRINTAYLWYADPAEVWEIDARYTTDPRGLYYARLAQLETLELRSVVIEATGGGSVDDVLTAMFPGTGDVILTHVSIYDASWMTVGWPADGTPPLNVADEMNNVRAVRFTRSVLQPLPRGSGLQIVMRKGSNSDLPAADAYPIHGSVTASGVVLPEGW